MVLTIYYKYLLVNARVNGLVGRLSPFFLKVMGLIPTGCIDASLTGVVKKRHFYIFACICMDIPVYVCIRLYLYLIVCIFSPLQISACICMYLVVLVCICIYLHVVLLHGLKLLKYERYAYVCTVFIACIIYVSACIHRYMYVFITIYITWTVT